MTPKIFVFQKVEQSPIFTVAPVWRNGRRTGLKNLSHAVLRRAVRYRQTAILTRLRRIETHF
jgi:hypothetical protein